MIVQRIDVAPVKGLGLHQPTSVELTELGVPGDRRYAMVDERDRMVNGKRMGPLVRVHATCADDPERLTLTMPDGSVVTDEVILGEPVAAVFYGRARAARLVLGPFAEALSALAGEPLRLVRLPQGEAVDRVGEGSVSLQTTASLDALGQALQAIEPIDARRFRMTFTIAGAREHVEDAWLGRRVRIGEAVIVPEGHVGRCAVTTQDPQTGIPDLQTLRGLAQYRGDLSTTEPLAFGIHARVLVPGLVSLGDAVVVH